MRNINIAAITTATDKALDAGYKMFDACTVLQAEFKGCDRETVQKTLLPIVAKWHGLTTKTQGTGRVVMQGNETKVNSATTALRRLVSVITATAKDKVEIDVPADILAAAAKLWELCAQYEKAGSICASAIATAKTGK